MPKILETRLICKQPERYIGWPTIAKAPDGTLYAVFSGDRDYHVCPFGKVFIMSSRDEGKTWSEPALVINTPLDDRDAGICVCPDGTLVVTWFTSHYRDYRRLFDKYNGSFSVDLSRWDAWEGETAKVTEETIRTWAPSYETQDEPGSPKRWMGFWTIRSKDGGKTWDKPTNSPVYAPHGANVLPNGDLIFLGMKTLSRLDGPKGVGFARSSDQGLTWDLLAGITSFPPYQGTHPGGFRRLAEPHVVQAASGKLIGVARCEESKNTHPIIHIMESEDGGHTWTEPRETGILGKPPYVTKLANGTILLSAGYRHAPYGQRIYPSLDEGASWNPLDGIVLRDDAENTDLGYASTAENTDGTLVTLYYQIEKSGEKPSLYVTRWTLED